MFSLLFPLTLVIIHYFFFFCSSQQLPLKDHTQFNFSFSFCFPSRRSCKNVRERVPKSALRLLSLCVAFFYFFFTAVESSSNLNFFSRYAASFRSFYFSRIINICSLLCLFCAYFLFGFSFQNKHTNNAEKIGKRTKSATKLFTKDFRRQREVNWQSFSFSLRAPFFFFLFAQKTVVETKEKKRITKQP